MSDTQPPQIRYCNGGTISYIADMLVPLEFREPEAIDNSAVMTWDIYPTNTRPSHAFNQATTISYKAVDPSGNAALCIVRVTIPGNECLRA